MSETNQAERQAIRIRPMMQFSTYQVRLAAYPKDASVPVHDCWKRAILRVISYLEYKLRDAGKDTELYKNILSYGTPEDYANFDPDTIEVGRFHIPMKLKTYYDKEQKTWTVFYNEPDGGLKHVPYPDGTYHDEAPVPDRSFLMDVSIMEEEECVAIAIRCICRDQEESIRTVRVIRPHFVKEMINDPMMLVTEYGVPARFAFNFGSMSPVNTKNASDSREFVEKLVKNPYRQLPILMYYVQDNGDNFTDSIQSLISEVPGYVHPIVLQGGGKKMLIPENGGDFYREDEIEKHLIEDGEMVLYSRTESRESAATVFYPTKDVDYSEEGGTVDILNAIRQDMLNRQMNFAPCVFNSELYYDSAERRIRKMTKGMDPDQSDKMVALLKEREDGYRELNEANQELKATIQNQQEVISKLKSENETLAKKNKKLDKELGHKDRQEENEQIRSNDVKGLQSRIEELEKENKKLQSGSGSGLNISIVQQAYKPLIALSDMKKDVEAFICWVRENYADTIILHPDAVRAIKKGTAGKDDEYWKRMYSAIHYLYGYTLERNKSGSGEWNEKEIRHLYEPLNGKYEISGTGNDRTMKTYEETYKMNIFEYDNEKEYVLMDKHVKCGSDPEKLVRVYFYYDEKIKKSIIGHMPDHLRNMSTN